MEWKTWNMKLKSLNKKLKCLKMKLKTWRMKQKTFKMMLKIVKRKVTFFNKNLQDESIIDGSIFWSISHYNSSSLSLYICIYTRAKTKATTYLKILI